MLCLLITRTGVLLVLVGGHSEVTAPRTHRFNDLAGWEGSGGEGGENYVMRSFYEFGMTALRRTRLERHAI